MRSPFSQFVFGFFLSFWPAPLVGFATYLLLVDRVPVTVEVVAPPSYGAPTEWLPAETPPEMPEPEEETEPELPEVMPEFEGEYDTPHGPAARPYPRPPTERRKRRDNGLPEL